jgi:hypothetical protein
MKNSQCKKCLNKFQQKDIYTIQQFQYRKIPPYKWSVKYFEKIGITEWNSFCEACMSEYSKESEKKWNESKI